MARHLLYCGTCDLPFITEYAGSSSCLPCWKTDQDYDLSKADKAHIMLQERLKQELDRPAPRRERTSSAKGLTKKNIKRLIRLCHPDKHDNSTLSTEMTKILNDMRE
jgi:recombinational DNA repair protein (RecF pathway)